VIRDRCHARDNRGMTNLEALSKDLADAVAAAAPSVVQVFGARRPASGVVHGPDTVITTARAIGREDGLRIRVNGLDDDGLEAELAGWDPATGIAVIRTKAPHNLAAPATATDEPRPGELISAIARSWSNAVTASAGVVAIVGGPLRTGRRREIPRVFRVTAPMHDGFAGGGIFNASRTLVGVATAATIRGFGVCIPASIVWNAALQVLTSGTPQRGFVGLSVHAIELPAAQRSAGRERALLIMAITPSSPADAAGLMVGDLLLDFDGRAVSAPEHLLDLLTDRRIGQTAVARTMRGGVEREVTITVAARPKASGTLGSW
jgi:S1-C subfamily serine protease